MQSTFGRDQFECSARTLLRDGRWANARVWRAEIGGAAWVVKDFAPRSILVRNLVGRFLLRRELRALRRLDGIDGVPAAAFRVDAHAIAARFVEGLTLGKVEAERLTTPFFEQLEQLLQTIHARGIVHLDLRGSGNMLMQPDGRPAVIDFQAALRIDWMPAALRRWFGEIDLAGVYKKWIERDAESMGADRLTVLARMNRWRRFWLLRGYAGVRKERRPGAA
jgi:hypothetical protein